MKVIFALAVWMFIFSGTPALANNYGAIAYDRPTGSWGASYDHSSQRAANESAMRECGKYGSHCEVVVKFWGGVCAAYAVGPGTTAGWGSSSSRSSAEARAVSACSSRGGPCQVKVWSCNTAQPAASARTPIYNRSQSYHCRYPNGSRVPDCYDP